VIHVDERQFQWLYSATALAGLFLALFLPSSKRLIPEGSRPRYGLLQLVTLLGAIVGAKLVFLAGDLAWPFAPVGWEQLVFSGRSITGGLLGGFLCAEAAKIPLRWRELPNDWFATKLPLSIAVGRVGCVLSGCCRGVPGDYSLSFVYSDGVARFPAQLCELLFQIGAFGVSWMLFRRGALRGCLFAAYMIAYGAFRFFLEGVRDTPKLASGLSIYQLASIALALCGLASFAWYARARRTRSSAVTFA
jgi:prolipoprotein diacylglyceryltransferase